MKNLNYFASENYFCPLCRPTMRAKLVEGEKNVIFLIFSFCFGPTKEVATGLFISSTNALSVQSWYSQFCLRYS
jgi:hypothetical protein